MESKHYSRNSNGLCASCDNARLPGKTKCQDCLDKGAVVERERQLKNREMGLCKCSKAKMSIGKYCLSCWCKFMLYSNTGTSQYGGHLLDKLEKQNYRCYYSNVLLVPGNNASIDHLIPESQGGTNELENLVWCDWTINVTTKHKRPAAEFLTLCRDIHLHITNKPEHPDYYLVGKRKSKMLNMQNYISKIIDPNFDPGEKERLRIKAIRDFIDNQSDEL